MQAEIFTIYHSPLCSVHNFLCHCQDCSVSEKEYQENFSIAYIRKGNFRFNVFRNDLDAYSGLFLICKPGYEYNVGHVHDMPDECTIFSFSPHSTSLLLAQAETFSFFFNNPDMQSLLVTATPEMEYLHFCIFNLLSSSRFPLLYVEQLMVELFVMVLSAYTKSNAGAGLTEKQKRYYLPVIETVKEFINAHYTEDISLSQLAALGNMSPFHFNRLFRQITLSSPYSYLRQIRLKEAQLQINNTKEPITSIAFATGFNSLEHFSAAYKKHFGQSPVAMRS